METPHVPKQVNSSEDTFVSEIVSMRLAEYSALREEIVKRLEFMGQISTLALIAPGTLFAFGLQNQSGSSILLYPVLAFFLSLLYNTNREIVRRIGFYIQIQIEAKVGKDLIGWEHFSSQDSDWSTLANIGIFTGPGLLAILLGMPLATRYGAIVPLPLLLIIAIVSMIFTIIVLVYPHLKKARAKVRSTRGKTDEAP